MRHTARLGIFALVAVVALLGVVALLSGVNFRTLRPHFAGTCREVALGAGAADVRLDRPRNLAYLAYVDQSAAAAGKVVLGTVMLIDLDAPEPRPRAAVTHDPVDFRPDGLSLYTPSAGPQRLFVISHRPRNDGAAPDQTIEILEQSPVGGFTPLESVRDPLLIAPRAVLAVGPRQFYVANGSGAHGGFERWTESLFHRALSTVDYFDGRALRPVLTGLASGAGLGANPDGSLIYVSEAGAHRVGVYRRNAATGDLTPERQIALPSAPAAIDVDGAGMLWVVGHPFARGLQPTQVFRISPVNWQPVEEYLAPGKVFSGGSAAAVSGKTLLIGSSTEHKLLRCAFP
jgi:hypothetical protein